MIIPLKKKKSFKRNEYNSMGSLLLLSPLNEYIFLIIFLKNLKILLFFKIKFKIDLSVHFVYSLLRWKKYEFCKKHLRKFLKYNSIPS